MIRDRNTQTIIEEEITVELKMKIMQIIIEQKKQYQQTIYNTQFCF